MRRYFRLNDSNEQPEVVLEPENQVSEPWGAPEQGHCDKCDGSGRTTYRCESCLAAGADEGCEACGGRVEFEGKCPTCLGTGEIHDSERHGVSVFPKPEGLLRYMLRKRADLDGCKLVELEGVRTGEPDFDADEGALLVRPTRIVSVSELDVGLVARLRRDAEGES